MPVMRTAIVIPTLGAPSITTCLAALARQTVSPHRLLVVHSGDRQLPPLPSSVEVLSSRSRMGFAAASNRGIDAVSEQADAVALLNDDAEPGPTWLATLVRTLSGDPRLGAAQGTVTDRDGSRVDGRGLAFDRWGLPIQIDRGLAASDENPGIEARWGVSATAALFRSSALDQIRLSDGSVFDESFDCYHEDTDLGMRMLRRGIPCAWVPGAPCRHLGSHTGSNLDWKHPWWLASNRWRTLAANLTPGALLASIPRLLRGELRVFATLCRSNPRAWLTEAALVFSLPLIVARSWYRHTPGDRLQSIPGHGT